LSCTLLQTFLPPPAISINRNCPPIPLSALNVSNHCHELSHIPLSLCPKWRCSLPGTVTIPLSLSRPPISMFIAMGFTISLSLSSPNDSVHYHELLPYPSIFLPPMSVFIATNCHHIPLSFFPQCQCSLP
jgi:hypothetical protein